MKHFTIQIAMSIILAAGALHPAAASHGLSAAHAATPSGAATRLYSAYRRCNRRAALKVASMAAVKKLFRRGCGGQGPGWQFMGCDRSGTGYMCSYYYEGGAVNMRVKRFGASGYSVVSVGFVAD
jgi:hypothetical protein